MKTKKVMALFLVASLTASLFTGCGQESGDASKDSGDASKDSGAAANESVSGENAGSDSGSSVADPYDGTGPITTEAGKELTVLAQTSNYANVDITAAPIVKRLWRMPEYP